MLKRFISMLEGLNAMSLAIGVIIGGAIGKVVASLTGDMIMPVVSLLIPGGSWRDAQIVLKRDAAGAVVNAVKLGTFVGTLVDFLIIAFVVMWLTMMLVKPAPAGPIMKTCPECKEKVLGDARKCKYCCSVI